MKKLSKTEMAIAVLLAEKEIANRGHAFKILQSHGLTGSGAVFNKAVAAYEAERDIKLGNAAAKQERLDKKALRAKAHQSSAAEVREHIESIDHADAFFWACWKVFRYEGKWANSLSTSDFAVHFSK